MSGVSRFLASLGMTPGKGHRYLVVVLRNHLKIRLARHPRAKAGVQGNPKKLDSRLRGNDDQWSMEHFEIASKYPDAVRRPGLCPHKPVMSSTGMDRIPGSKYTAHKKLELPKFGSQAGAWEPATWSLGTSEVNQRTSVAADVTASFDIPCSIFCGSLLPAPSAVRFSTAVLRFALPPSAVRNSIFDILRFAFPVAVLRFAFPTAFSGSLFTILRFASSIFCGSAVRFSVRFSVRVLRFASSDLRFAFALLPFSFALPLSHSPTPPLTPSSPHSRPWPNCRAG